MLSQYLKQKTANSDVFLWALYDFANSLAFVNVSFYFGLWLVSDLHLPDIWISLPTVLSTVLLFLSLPVLGSISDRSRRRMPFLSLFTIASVILLLALGTLAMYPTKLNIVIIICLYFLFQYTFQASLAFYDAMLQKVAIRRSKEYVSGLGMAAGQMGNALGLLLVLPFVGNNTNFFGTSGRPSAFIIGAVLFLVFSMPFILFFKEKHDKRLPKTPSTYHVNNPWQSIKSITKHPGVLNYLASYYLFSDALLTLQLFATVYLEIVGGLNDQFKTFVVVAGLLMAVLGSIASSYISKIFKGTRNTISILIASWAISTVLLAITSQATTFIIVGAINGFFFGALYSLSRAYYSDLAPRNRQAEFFGVYTLFERFASVLGPLVWSISVIVFAPLGMVTRYRFAMLSLAAMLAISLIVLHIGKEPQKKASI